MVGGGSCRERQGEKGGQEGERERRERAVARLQGYIGKKSGKTMSSKEGRNTLERAEYKENTERIA